MYVKTPLYWITDLLGLDIKVAVRKQGNLPKSEPNFFHTIDTISTLVRVSEKTTKQRWVQYNFLTENLA